MDRVYIKYNPKNKLQTYEAIIPNQKYQYIKAL